MATKTTRRTSPANAEKLATARSRKLCGEIARANHDPGNDTACFQLAEGLRTQNRRLKKWLLATIEAIENSSTAMGPRAAYVNRAHQAIAAKAREYLTQIQLPAKA